jgi:hypothetical protein
MKLLLKILFWTSISLLSFWSLTPLLGIFIPVEFSTENYENIFDGIRFYGVPVAIIFTLTGTLKKKDTIGIILTKVFLTLRFLS